MSSTLPTPPSPERSAGLKEYLKRAFLYRWNLLAFCGGLIGAVLSPWPDATLPLLAAAEVTYLSLLVGAPKFRKAIDALVYQEYRESRKAPTSQGQRSVGEIVAALPAESRRRFDQVRARCLDMRAIATSVRGQTAGLPAGEDLSTNALDRLLWVFLRLLLSEEALQRFLQRTNPDEIRSRLEDARARLEKHTGGDERIVKSLQDHIAAQEMRLQNHERAAGNLEFVHVELDRIEAKIQALAESSVNRQDPNFLSSQIDSVAETMHSTEKAITELQQITGLVDEMQEPPAILESSSGKVTS